ncbi:hypothetical protein ACQEVB_40620 [Pseudonocardia sp. CA-107938]|uniref:hypothetical protein n=1 Tax=Pseudonocardia sp. CA-107938 TaxID=3240021 RepID=UPI003D8FC791
MANVGTAAHIFAAADGGPRGTGGLTPEQRSDLSNGIWLCAHHGRLVDTNEGGAYPAALLQGWRGLHDARTRLALGGRHETLGWIERLKVANAPAIGDHELVLSSHNLIVGRNGVGKTLLLQILSSAADPDRLARLTQGGRAIIVDLVWHDPQRRTLTIRANGRRTRFVLDGVESPFVPRPYRVLFYREWRGFSAESAANAYGLGKVEFVNAVAQSRELTSGCIADADVDADGALVVRLVQPGQPDRWVKPGSPNLSGNELLSINLDICLTISQVKARESAAILILDAITGRLTPNTQQEVYDRLTSRNWKFQVITTSTDSDRIDIGADWLITHLRRRRGVGAFSIDQER